MSIEEQRDRRSGLRRFVTSLPNPAGVKVRFDRKRNAEATPSAPERDELAAGRTGRWFPDDAVGRAMATIVDYSSEPDPVARRVLIRSVFDDLHPLDAEQLAERYAVDVAELGGVPAPLRYTANQALIDARCRVAEAELQRVREGLNSAIDELATAAPRARRMRKPLGSRLGDVEAAAQRVAIANQFREPFVDHLGREVARQFLSVVPSMKDSSGRVVEVFGDLTRATNVLIVVPGVSNHYSTFHETRTQSETLARHAATEHPGEHIAVIEWMGYDVPGWMRGALSHAANHGGPELQAFVEGLDLAPDVEVTLVGHSYGSIVVSEAVRVGLKPHRVVFTGSPGVHADHAEKLGLAGGSVYALAAPRDVISRLRWHGKNPAAKPFGATRLATEGYGHASYFKPGGLSLRNLIHVALGRIDQVVEATTAPLTTNPGLVR